MLQKNINLFLFLFFGLLFAVFAVRVSASDYVLPYPSFMPGNKLYTVSRILDKIQNYWYWGDIAQSRYHLDLSDKYLVEAKTLFEYKQYLLAEDALKRSMAEFAKIPQNLQKAQTSGEKIGYLIDTVKSASIKHQEVLQGLEPQLPEMFVWSPEKTAATTLYIHQSIDDAIVTLQKENL